MAKTISFRISDSVKSAQISEFIADDKLFWGLFQNSFPVGTQVCLLPGGMYIGTFEGHNYIQHRVIIWTPGNPEPEVIMLAKSKHIFSHLGVAEDGSEMPLFGLRESNAGNQTPDTEWINESSPFQFKVLSRVDGNKTAYNVVVDHEQWMTVDEIRRYWTPKYSGGVMVLTKDSEHPELKRMSKPHFVAYEPTKSQKDAVKSILEQLESK